MSTKEMEKSDNAITHPLDFLIVPLATKVILRVMPN